MSTVEYTLKFLLLFPSSASLQEKRGAGYNPTLSFLLLCFLDEKTFSLSANVAGRVGERKGGGE